jgi:predicted amidophosphoribosyltransferase
VLVEPGTTVRAGLLHTAAARALVHRLKYQGLVAAAGPLAGVMAGLLDPLPPALVPVPRALARRWRYGIDPGSELAAAVGAIAGVPVIPALRAGWWHRRRAGAAGAPRGAPRFRRIGVLPAGVVLVDDVVTTGATLAAAAAVLGAPGWALTATAAPSIVGASPGSARLAGPDSVA